MPCPTCGHTLAPLSQDGDRSLFLCERCGTVRMETPSWTEDYVPKLVERCRRFEEEALPAEHHDMRSEMRSSQWRSLGIPESIYPPEQRATS